MLVRIVKDWDWPDVMRQTPGGKGVWDGIRFTCDPVDECDVLVMLNNRMKTDVTVRCPRENVWAIMQEPYVRGFNDWMAEGLESYARVFSHYRPEEKGRYIVSHPALPWHVNRTFDELVSSGVPEKVKPLSWIVGNVADIPGHFKRLAFLKHLQRNASIPIDLYGKAVRFIEDKWDGIAPYKYSLAVENSRSTDYWTEKFADCILAWSVPLYDGCVNLETYFPPGSFIRIDITKPEKTVAEIKDILEHDQWQARLPALAEARKLILHKYQLFPHLASLIPSYAVQRKSGERIVIPAYRRSNKVKLLRAMFKLERVFFRLYYR
jgi:hypothetical protein